MAGTAYKNLRTFKKMVGSGSMTSVSLVSTMWSASTGKEEGERDFQLRTKVEYWKSMIDEGATPYRHTNDRESAFKIIRPLLQKDPTVLKMQHEMVDQGKKLNNTEAGREVDAGISLQRELLEKKIEDTKVQMNQALAEKDQKWVNQLAADQEKYEQQVKDTRSAQEEMKSSMEKIFAEKEEQYKKSLEEIDGKLRKAEEERAKREKQYEEAKESARKDKEMSDRKAAEQAEAITQAQNVAEEANTDKYMAQIAMITSWMERREASEEEARAEHRKAAEMARLQKEEEILALQMETARLKREREQMAKRQYEHEQAMMAPPPYQSQPSSPPILLYSQPTPQQYLDQQTAQVAQAAAVGVGAGLVATGMLCCIM